MALNFGQGDCNSDNRGSGKVGCEISSFGDISGILLLKRGTNLNTILASESAYKTAIKDGLVYPYTGIYNFEQNTPENETSTSGTGVMSLIRSGRPQFSFQFTQGSCMHKSLYDKRGNDIWDIVLVFETGILLSAKGQLPANSKGFRVSLFDVGTFRILQGTDPQSTTAMVQLMSAEDFNMNHQFVSNDNLGFNVNDINGAVDVELTIVSASATSIVVNAKSSCNHDVPINDIDTPGNWQIVTNTGTTITPTSITEGANGRYTLTGTGFASGNLILNGVNSLEDAFKGKVALTIS